MNFPFVLRTRASLAAEIAASAKVLAEEHAADLAKRYAHNVDCLRAAAAAHANLPIKYVGPESMLLVPTRRCIEAFAETMGRKRGEGA